MPAKVWWRTGAVVGAVLVASLGVIALWGQGERALAMSLAAFLLAIGSLVAWMLLPDVDLPGRTLRRGIAGAGRVALTFDDGPNGVHTAALLDVLARHGARATFFCLGEAALRYPDLIRRMHREGHVVGNHTRTHALLPRLGRRTTREEVESAQLDLQAVGGMAPRLFRAPKGWKNPFLPAVLRRCGLRLVGWSRGVWDTDRPGVDHIVRRALPALRDGAILLLHDGLPGHDRSQTVAAVDRLLVECHRRGLTAVTVPELERPSV